MDSTGIPEEIRTDIEKAALLHQRTAADYEKCLEFNRSISVLLVRLEDASCHRAAGRLMSILLDCNPKPGSQCDKASRVAGKMRQFEPPCHSNANNNR